MTRPFEVVYIFDAALEEAAISERLARFHALIQIAGAEAPQVNHWGKRTLAYPIKKHETGYYVVAKFEADTKALPEFERAIKLDESVLRFLVVANDGPQPVPAAAGDPPMVPSKPAAGAAATRTRRPRRLRVLGIHASFDRPRSLQVRR